MKNREKYLDEILAEVLMNLYGTKELRDKFNLRLGQNTSFHKEEVLEWLQEEYKEPEETEYIEVTNDIPRFTEIEIRDLNSKEWRKAKFLCKLDNDKTKHIYVVLSKYENYYSSWSQARVRKDWREENDVL